MSLSHSHTLILFHSHTVSLSHCLALTLSHSHTLTLSLSHSLTLHMLNNFCFHVYAQKSLSHSHSLSLSHSHSFSLSHYFNLSFNHSRHAEQVLFSCLCSKLAVYSRKLQCIFWDLHSTRSTDIRVHRAGSQLKMNIFSPLNPSNLLDFHLYRP